MHSWSRRDLLQFFAASTLAGTVPAFGGIRRSTSAACRIRTITAGVSIASPANLTPISKALKGLARVKQVFVDAGYEVQTVRVATNPFVATLTPGQREQLIPALRQLDDELTAAGGIASLGPVLLQDMDSPDLPEWISEVLRTTTRLSLTVAVASSGAGSHTRAAAVAAKTIRMVSQVTPGGTGNFRFAAAALIPAGTPFFPVAYHAGPGPTIALGLEAAGLVEAPLASTSNPAAATAALITVLASAFRPVETLARKASTRIGSRYLGIDPSPAPGLDRSIGAALEGFIGGPFGGPGTLEACGVVTAALKRLPVQICGYAGLMLPVLEDPRLAERASEGRYGMRELLLYSSVCGTGLDVVPVPGNSSEADLTRVIRDVSSLAVKWNKPLSARLFPIPDGKPGDLTSFDDPLLTNSRVLALS